MDEGRDLVDGALGGADGTFEVALELRCRFGSGPVDPTHRPRRRVGEGGEDARQLNGLARGMGLAAQEGRMTAAEAVDFIEDIVKGGLGSGTGWRNALRGMTAQVRRKDSTAGELAKFVATSAVRYVYPYRGGLLARVYGTKDGKPAVSTRRTAMRTGRAFTNMGGVTGTATAAFAVLALEEAGTRAGAFAPEDWADPASFYRALEKVGVPPHEIVETVH